ncbi:hypothetical protein [Micromonospora noduli]|uniref:Uncharacterized protein n=2 Tax=Micromonospora noduli TaxID=709876 RepID=A0A328MU86_9ACTN|nr:hypothetical protein [Micromonospora noduli]RAN94173.1 hypothetical protein LAH08_06008 [Micromonospora noduli]RAN97392.1 hypothetical protein GUI43_06203 [Micromonospora noduli]RAO54087.1 hypothetical protein ONO86_01296 [Micromonospora noduli]
MAVDSRRTRAMWATAAAVLSAAALSACGSGSADPAAAPAPSSAAPSSAATPTDVAPPPIKGKLRGYATVRQLSDAADLVVRGEVEAAGFRVDEVLRATTGSTVRAGARITLAPLPAGVPDMAHMSKLEAGQVVVLYLAQDPAAPTFRTLSGDFGVFDLTGSGAEAVATTRSQAMAVSGLNAEDPAASGHGFRTTLGQLRAVAAQAE